MNTFEHLMLVQIQYGRLSEISCCCFDVLKLCLYERLSKVKAREFLDLLGSTLATVASDRKNSCQASAGSEGRYHDLRLSSQTTTLYRSESHDTNAVLRRY